MKMIKEQGKSRKHQFIWGRASNDKWGLQKSFCYAGGIKIETRFVIGDGYSINNGSGICIAH